MGLTWRPRGLSKSVISRAIIGVQGTYNSTYNLVTKSPGGLRVLGFRFL